MENPEKDLTDYLVDIGRRDYAEIVSEHRKGIIRILMDKENSSVPVGASKFGGFPDLPPEIPYPTMSGYTGNWGDRKERYEKSAMQLVAQINLAELAEYDKDDLLPHTGILYFFWSGEIAPIHSKNRFYEGIADDPDNADIHKVIWYNGDLSALKRTEPPLPYYAKYFTEAFQEAPIRFCSDTDYRCMGYVLDTERFDELAELAPDYDIDYLSCNSDKLFGYPTGGNCPSVDEHTHLLLQYDYSVGCLWNLFWLISDDALKRRDFSKTFFSYDMD